MIRINDSETRGDVKLNVKHGWQMTTKIKKRKWETKSEQGIADIRIK